MAGTVDSEPVAGVTKSGLEWWFYEEKKCRLDYFVDGAGYGEWAASVWRGQNDPFCWLWCVPVPPKLLGETEKASFC